MDIISTLLAHDEPAIRYRTLVDVQGRPPDSPEVAAEQSRIATSEISKRLLSQVGADGTMPRNVYAKYCGAHWILADLAEIGYPSGEKKLAPLRDQVYDFWLSPTRTEERVVDGESAKFKSKPGVPVINGLALRCASQEGNALYATLKLGLIDERTHRLAENLKRWQWPDGGWNCDR